MDHRIDFSLLLMANDVSPKQKGEYHLHQGFCSKEGFKENQIHVQESPRALKSSHRKW